MARETKPAEILAAIRDRLIATAGFNRQNCAIAQPDADFRIPPGQTYATIWMDGGNFDLEIADGGLPVLTASVTVTLYSEILTDKSGRDDLATTDGDRGILALVDKVFQSLWLHDLLDAESVALLAEPMRPVSLGEPTRTPGQPGTATISWQVMFEWTVD